MVEGVSELGEDQEPLVRVIEEPLLLQDGLESAKLRFSAGCLDCLRFVRKIPELGDLFADIPCVARQRDCLQHLLQALSLGILHLFELVRIVQVGRRRLNQFLRLFEVLLQSVGALLQGSAHGVGAGCEPSLIQGHEEADGACPAVVVLHGRAAALLRHEPADLLVQVELVAVDGE